MLHRATRILVLTIAAACLSLAVPGAALAVGEITQKAGTAGCISEDGTGGSCVDGTGLTGAEYIAISPDGTSVYVASLTDNAIAVFDRATDGSLTQKSGLAGCVSEDGSGGTCTDGRALNSPKGIAVSPDGKTVYVASYLNKAVVVFDRAANGSLTQKAGLGGCVSDDGLDGSGGNCTDVVELRNPTSIGISPDGTSLYVGTVGTSAILVFDRATDGLITQKAGKAGCVSETGSGGVCANGNGLVNAYSVIVSHDGKNVYSVSFTGNNVVILDRATDGSLTQKPGLAGCISETGAGGCTDGSGLDQPFTVALSSDGASAYVASRASDAVAIFDRSADGSLTQKAGVAGCISEDGTGGACTDGAALDRANGLVVSADNGSVYVASSSSSALSTFDRAANGSLTQKAGTAGCVSSTGTGGACAIGVALTTVTGVTISSDGTSVYSVSVSSKSVSVFDRARPVADLGVTVTDAPDPVVVGSDITYAIVVSNAGPNAASGVVVTSVLPAGVTFKSAGTSSTCTNASGTVTCNLGVVAASGSKSATIIATTSTAGTVSNSVSVKGHVVDSVAGNNSATAKTTVSSPAGSPTPVTPVAPTPGVPTTPGVVTTCPAGTSTNVSCVSRAGGGLIITGTAGNDRLAGSSGPDIIHGGAGDDTILGGGGNDSLRGGDGKDAIAGNGGDDVLIGGHSADRLLGGPGADTLIGGTGFDRLDGGAGNDRIFGQSGNDFVQAGRGNDVVATGVGDDFARGESGNDVLIGSGGDDVLLGGDGNDRLIGGPGADRLFGQGGADTSFGQAGDDLVSSGAGNDRSFPGAGADTVFAGAGNDVTNSVDSDGDRVACQAGTDLLIADARDRSSSCERRVIRSS